MKEEDEKDIIVWDSVENNEIKIEKENVFFLNLFIYIEFLKNSSKIGFNRIIEPLKN